MTSNGTQERLLSDVNREEARKYYGFIAFAAILFLPAVIGNLHTLHIYIFKKKPSNTRVYVCFIAVLDMINFVVCCPFYVVNCLHPFTFYSSAACKLFNVITYFINICIPFSLLVISVDRFRVICRPFRAQISKRLSRFLCVLTAIVSFVFSLPTVVLFGSVPIETGSDNLIGRECERSPSVWSKIYITILSVMTVTEAIILIILYSFMAITVRRQQMLLKNSGINYASTARSKTETQFVKCENCEKVNAPKTAISSVKVERSGNSHNVDSESFTDADRINISILTENCSMKSCNKAGSKHLTNTTDLGTCFCNGTDNDQKTEGTLKKKSTLNKPDNGKENFIRTKRTTMMFFWITLIYIVSFLPNPALRVARDFRPDWYTNVGFAGQLIYHTLIGTVFIASATNFFVYIFCDSSFRKEVRSIYRHLLHKC